MPRGQNRLSALLVAAFALPIIITLPAGADPASDWPNAPADHAAAAASLQFPTTTTALPSGQFDHRDFAVKRREASLPLAAPDRAPRERALANAAARRTDERKPRRQNASRRLHNKPPATKSPVALHGAKTVPAGIAGPTERGVAAVTPTLQPHAAALRAKLHARATNRLPRELFIDRVAASDADDVMPAQPVTSVIRLPLAPPSAAMAAERYKYADNETVSLRATPLEPLNLN
jgi:hypothetical protein